jgi:energy-coupling factor transport system ATP-binding protein
LSEDSIEKRVRDSIARIGLEYDKIAHRSPFELSGGEKRLVAMAGVLAMNPRVLVLDEPTSGLDADGKDRIMRIINGLNETGTTIILVTHDMNDVADFAERVVVFNDGRIVIDGVVENVFADTVLIEMFGELGLGIPVAVQVLLRARERGLAFELGAVRINDVVDRIKTVRGPCFREGDAGE